jgi:hypothetical protein
VLSCTTTLTVGDSAYNTTAVYVYIKNNTTGRLYRFSVTTDGAGLITANISSVQMIPDHNYELWVTLASATNTEEKIDFTIDGETKNCLDVSFQRVFNTDDELQSGAQTLTLSA